MSQVLKNLIGFILICACIKLSVQLSLNNYLSLNHEQKTRLDMFRELMTNRVPHAYMAKDAYLIRWLRDRDFDVPAAQELLLNHIQWRRENRIDSVTEEDWTDFDYDFPILIEGCSKDSHLVLSMKVGDWDISIIRKYVLAGKRPKLMRYLENIFEQVEDMIQGMQDNGENTTQATVLMDLSNFNLFQHGCAQCLPVFFYDMKLFSYNYVGFAHKVICVNTPEIALPIWNILKNLLNQRTRDTVSIYGKNKAQWSSQLLQEIEPDQLSRTFGGLNQEGVDLWELKARREIYKCKKS